MLIVPDGVRRRESARRLEIERYYVTFIKSPLQKYPFSVSYKADNGCHIPCLCSILQRYASLLSAIMDIISDVGDVARS